MRNRAARTKEVPKTHGPSGTGHSPSTQLSEWLGPEKGTKHTAHLGLCPCGAPENLSSLDRGSAWNKGDTLSPHRGQCTCRARWSQSIAGLGSACRLWGNPAWSIRCEHSPHMLAAFVWVSLPLHITIEQVSLNKGPPLPPRVRVEIRHWRDLETEEAKTNKEGRTALEVTGATD